MKETRPEKVEKARQVLEELKQLRGGSVISAHKRMANDPELLETFTYNFQHCKSGLKHLEPKTVELLLLALGCAKGASTTIKVHGNQAYQTAPDSTCRSAHIASDRRIYRNCPAS